MTREELIEEAANAMSQGYVQDGRISSFFALAEAALAVFEKAQAPTDDERAELLAEADDLVSRWDRAGSWTPDSPIGLVMRLARFIRRPAQGERSPEFDSLEQELFKHQPVLSMRDGSIAGCQCLDRVFHKDAEVWGTHLAEVFESLRPAQAKPTDAQVERAARSIAEWNTSDVPFELCRAVARDALRAAFSVRDVKP